MNGSDALKNPDGDGFDINKNGVIDQEEAFVNWLEYHMKSEILLQDSTHSGMKYPDNFTSNLPHHSWQGLANEAFGEGPVNTTCHCGLDCPMTISVQQTL